MGMMLIMRLFGTSAVWATVWTWIALLVLVHIEFGLWQQVLWKVSQTGPFLVVWLSWWTRSVCPAWLVAVFVELSLEGRPGGQGVVRTPWVASP